MTYDAGRIRHDMSLMHYSRMSNGTAVPSNWRPSATGDTGVTWSPESATSVSYGSNANDVGTADAGGASSLASRADHVHKGVRSVSISSNTLVGDVTLLGEGSVGVTVAGQTVKFNVAPTTGGASVSYGSNSNQVSYANAPGVSTLVSRTDHVHLGVTSLSHTSNTFAGPVILTASGSVGITVPTPGTFNFSAVTGSGGSGGSGPTDYVSGPSGSGHITIPGLAVPDRVPTSPSAFDDEFDTTSTFTTALGTLDTSNTTDAKSHLHQVKTATGGVGLFGHYKTAPSFPFTATVKMSGMLTGAIYQAAYLILGVTSPGSFAAFGMTYSGAASAGIEAEYSVWSTNTSRSSVATYTGNFFAPQRYFQVIATSTSNIAFYTSYDGLLWKLMASGLNPGITITTVGLVVGSATNSVKAEAVWDFVRFT